jgi:hypothetical protein
MDLRSLSRRGVAAASLATMLLTGPALAADEHVGEHPADHALEHSGNTFVITLIGSDQGGFAHGEAHNLAGGGIGFEAAVVPNWFEIEIAARGLTGGHGVTIPIELLFKIPFHASEVVHPFVGIGPFVSLTRDDTVEATGGGVLVGGTYLWATQHVGFVIEALYAVADDHGVVHELAGNAGLAFGF